MRVILILVVLIVASCARLEFSGVSPLSIESINLKSKLPPGEYGIFECVSRKYVGTLLLIDGSERRFCVNSSPSPITGDFGVIEVDVGVIEICKWVETGYCENGSCDSIYVKDECISKKI